MQNIYVKTHPRPIIVGIRPISMELNDIGMVQLRQVLEHRLDFLLLVFEVFPLGKLDLVPDYLHALFRIHRQEGAVDSRHIALFHLKNRTTPTTLVILCVRKLVNDVLLISGRACRDIQICINKY